MGLLYQPTRLHRLKESIPWIPEPVFLDLLRSPGIDSQPGSKYDNPICRTSHQRRWTWTGDFKCREVKTGFYRNGSMQTGSSGTLIGWESGQTSFVPLWDWMEGAWLRTLARLAASIPWNQLLGSINVYIYRLCAPWTFTNLVSAYM